MLVTKDPKTTDINTTKAAKQAPSCGPRQNKASVGGPYKRMFCVRFCACHEFLVLGQPRRTARERIDARVRSRTPGGLVVVWGKAPHEVFNFSAVVGEVKTCKNWDDLAWGP